MICLATKRKGHIQNMNKKSRTNTYKHTQSKELKSTIEDTMEMIIEKSSNSKIVGLIIKEECPNMKSQHKKIKDIKISKHEFGCTNEFL